MNSCDQKDVRTNRWKTRARRSTLFVRTVLLLFVVVGGLCFTSGCRTHSEDEILAQVGETAISNVDVAQRAAIEAAYGGDTLSQQKGVIALVNDAIEREVARRLGLLPLPEEINAFVEHVESTTKAPDVLRRVKAIFGSDTASYIRLYLEPKIISRKLTRYERYDSAVQRECRMRIERAFGIVAAGGSFEDAARQVSGVYSLDTIGRQPAQSVDSSPISLLSNHIEQDDSFDPIASRLKPGVLFDQVIEDDYTYRIVRLLRQDGGARVVEMLAVVKMEYSEWLRAEAESVSITIRHSQLAESLRRDYSHLWWIEKKV